MVEMDFLLKTGSFVNVNFAFSPVPDTSAISRVSLRTLLMWGWGLYAKSAHHLLLKIKAISAAADPNCMAATVTERPAAFVSFRRH